MHQTRYQTATDRPESTGRDVCRYLSMLSGASRWLAVGSTSGFSMLSGASRWLAVGGASGLLILIGCTSFLPVHAQLPSWGIHARERSQALCSSAQNYLIRGEYDQAITLLLQASQADPKDPLPYSLLGMALNVQGRYQEALDALRKGYQLDAKSREIILSVGFTNYLAHQYEQAISILDKLLKLHPDVHAIHSNLGYAFMRKGDFENAEKCFRRAVKQSPGSQVAYQGLATIQYLTGNFLAARQSALQSQAIRPYAPVVLLLAKIDFMEGEIQQGQKRLAEYTKLTKAKVTRSMTELGYLPQHDFKWDPFQLDDFDDAAFVEARTAERSKQAARQKTLKASADASISRIEKSLSVAPNDYYLLHELGLIKLSIGDFESAAAKLQQAAKSCPDAYLISLHACVALAQSGKIGAAQAALAEYKQAFPNQRLAPIFESIASQPSQAPVQTSNESNPLFAAPTSKDKAGAKDKPDTGF